jgi:hypothetical protein
MYIDPDRLLPNDVDRMHVQLLQVGGGGYPAAIIDNFYRDPDHVREVALGLHYLAPPAGHHPGYRAMLSLSLEPVLKSLYDCLAHQFYSSFESMLREAHPWHFHRWGKVPEARRRRPVSDRPHTDSTMLAGVVYLNPPEQCRGGTSLYRHVETGVEALLPPNVFGGFVRKDEWYDDEVVERMKAMGAYDKYLAWKEDHPDLGYHSYSGAVLNTPGEDDDFITDSAGGWELARLLEMRYNRLVMYPGFVIHSAYYRPEWFGTTPDTERLTQNLFLKWPTRDVDPAR